MIYLVDLNLIGVISYYRIQQKQFQSLYFQIFISLVIKYFKITLFFPQKRKHIQRIVYLTFASSSQKISVTQSSYKLLQIIIIHTNQNF